MARPQLQPEQVKEFQGRLIDTALALCSEEGPDGLTFRALGRALGCSHATPYRYFANKREIWAAVRAEGFRRFSLFLERCLGPDQNPEEKLRRIGCAYFDFAAAEPQAFRVMFELNGPEGPGGTSGSEEGRAAWSVLREVVSEAIDAGVIQGSVTTAAHLFWASLHGLTTLHAAGKLSMGRTARELVRPVVDTLIRAHRPRQ